MQAVKFDGFPAFWLCNAGTIHGTALAVFKYQLRINLLDCVSETLAIIVQCP